MEAATEHQHATPAKDGRRALAVTLLGTLFLGLAVMLWTFTDATPFPDRPYKIPWWAIALIRAGLGLLPAAAVIRSEAVTTTLNDFALIIGLALSDPLDLVVGLGVGQLLVNVHRPRLWGKAAFNATTAVLEATVALALVAVLRVDAAAVEPQNLLAIVVAAIAANATSYLAVLAVIRAVSGRVPVTAARLAGQLGAGTALLTATGGITLVAALWLEPWVGAAACTFVVLLALLVRFVGAATQRSHRLALLDDAVSDLHHATTEDDVRSTLMERARDLANARGVALVGDGFDDPLGARQFGLGPAATTLDVPVEAYDAVRMAAEEVGRTASTFLRRRGEGHPHDTIAVPVPDGDGAPAVLVVVDNQSDVDRFDLGDAHVLTDLARHAASALAQHRLVERLREEADTNDRLAHSDSLTGLPNRRGLRNLMRDNGDAAMLATVDLARMGALSAAFGETVSSTVLLELSARLRDVAGQGGVVARVGDRGFAVTTPDLFDPAVFGRLLHDTLLRPVRVGDLRVDPEVAVGVVVIDATDEPSEVLRRGAVAAAIARGSAGSERICVYEPEHDDQHMRRLRLTSDLRDAIARGELELHYQPKADLRTGRIVGVEALSRWTHHTLGPISPLEFVGLAEQAGLIGDLTRWCLATAAGDAARLSVPIPVAVNLSANDLMNPDLPTTVEHALEAATLAPELLRVEVTESVMVEDFDRSRAVLGDIVGLGVSVSIDDFGAGYASFAHLRRLIADELKLDRSLVMTLDHDGDAIVRAVVTLAREMGLHTVAEGVEDRRTWDQLAGLGVDAAQGWFLGRPMPVEGLHDWLGAYTAPSGDGASLVR